MNAATLVSLLAFKTSILAVAVLVAWVLLKVLPIRSPGLHRLVWGGVLLLGIFGAGFPVTIPVEKPPEPIRVESPVSISHGNLPQAVGTKPVRSEVAPPRLVREIAEPKVVGVADAPLPYGRGPDVDFSSYVFPAILFVWACGILVLLVRRLYRYLTLLKHLKTSVPASGNDISEWRALLNEHGIRARRLALLLTDGIGPALVRTPRGTAVVVPENLWREATDRVKSGILRHELAHYRQHDLPLCFIVRLLSLVHWFNPFSWLALSKFEEATEWACDAAAFGDDARGELHFAESMLAIHEATPSISLRYSAFASGRLSRRASLLRSIITQPKESLMKKSVVLFVALLLMVAGAVHVRFVVLAEGQSSPSTKRKPVSVQRAKFSNTLVESFDPVNAASEQPTMTLTVLDPEGKPLTGRMFKTHRFDKDQKRIFKRYTTDDAGKAVIDLPKKSNVGTFTFTVQAPGYTPFHGRWERENFSGDLPSACSVKLEKAKTVGGMIRNEDGKPVAGVKVEFGFPLERHTNGPNPSLGCPCGATTDEEGRWTYSCVPEDVQQPRSGLTLLHDDYLPTRIEGVSFADLSAGPDGTFSYVTTIRRGLAFRGTVKDDSGKPIGGAKIEIEFSDVYGSSEERYRQTTADADGRFTLSNCPVSKRAVVVGSAAGFGGSWTETAIGPEAKPLELTLPPGKPIKLRIVDSAGKPIHGAYGWTNSWGPFTSYGPILSRMLRDEKNWSAPMILPVDDTGLWTWTDAPTGPISITVEAPGFMGQRVNLEGGGETKIVTLAFTLQITGKVVDDKTGKPIAKFDVTEGLDTARSDRPLAPGQDRTSWQTQRMSHENGGTFTCKFSRPEKGRRLLVEADGYEPCESRVIGNDEGAVELEFRMKPLNAQELARQKKAREQRTGRIETPDGKPAAFATVVYATSGPRGGIGLTMHYLEGHAHRSVKADKDGRFTLPSIELDETQKECYAFVVVHDSGFARIEQDDFEKTYDSATKKNAPAIKLRPWSTVEGTVRIGAKPTVEAEVNLMSRDGDFRHVQGIPRISYHYSTKTDANGRFKFNRVAPAKYQLARMRSVPQADGMTANYPLESALVEIKSGETKIISLGGSGRPVVGRVEATPELKKLLEKGDQRVTIHAALPPKLPEELQKEVERIQAEAEKIKDEPEKLKALQEKWLAGESGRKFTAIMAEWRKEQEQSAAKNSEIMANGYMGMIGKDGSFRVEDVPAGNWTIRIDLYKDDFQHAGAAEPRNFTIPAIPGGRSDEAFDSGTIPVK